VLLDEGEELGCRAGGDAVAVFDAAIVQLAGGEFPGDFRGGATLRVDDISDRDQLQVMRVGVALDIVLDQQRAANALDIDRHAGAVIGEGGAAGDMVR
jgi:hypothetical protein